MGLGEEEVGHALAIVFCVYSESIDTQIGPSALITFLKAEGVHVPNRSARGSGVW